jgi:hypothetical protein
MLGRCRSTIELHPRDRILPEAGELSMSGEGCGGVTYDDEKSRPKAALNLMNFNN